MLRKQIRLEKWVSAKDGYGDFKETWVPYNLWAEVQREGGSRATTNGKTSLNTSMRFRVRFRPDFDVSGNWRVIYDGRGYTVRSIEKENENRFYWIIRADD